MTTETITPVDVFTSSYIEAALWSTLDESTESGGFPLDKNYTDDDLAPDTIAQIVADCKRFQEENSDDIATWEGDYTPDDMAGYDFWMTRNGHGVGFWDGDWGDVGERLTEACKEYPEVNLYVGDDGKIYC
jgi:hypothetical protein